MRFSTKEGFVSIFSFFGGDSLLSAAMLIDKRVRKVYCSHNCLVNERILDYQADLEVI